jgi:hypothetical protein
MILRCCISVGFLGVGVPWWMVRVLVFGVTGASRKAFVRGGRSAACAPPCNGQVDLFFSHTFFCSRDCSGVVMVGLLFVSN